MSALTLAGSEPYFRRGGPTGCLVAHGFASSPGEVRWLAAHLAEAGHTVYAPRLPGHGTQARDLARVTWQDWLACLRDGAVILQQQCDALVLVGHSMGGLLMLALALEIDAAGVAVLASPVQFASRGIAYSRWLKYVRRSTDQTDRTGLTDIVRAEQARRGEPALGRIRYDRWYTAGVAQLYALSIYVQTHLPEVQPPLLLMYSEGDTTAPPRNGRLIHDRAGSADKTLIVLERSGHNLPIDRERDRVFEDVAAFVAQVTRDTGDQLNVTPTRQ